MTENLHFSLTVLQFQGVRPKCQGLFIGFLTIVSEAHVVKIRFICHPVLV